MTRLSVLLALPLVAACAADPATIAPAPMAGAFAGLPCAEVAQRLVEVRARLAAAEAAQAQTAGADALGVFLIGLPIGSLGGGDRAAEIAVARGEVLALEARAGACR